MVMEDIFAINFDVFWQPLQRQYWVAVRLHIFAHHFYVASRYT
jgi:hypothetical protein